MPSVDRSSCFPFITLCLFHVIIFLFVPLCSSAASEKSITYYLDGACEELQLSTNKGYLEFQLPNGAVVASLGVKPIGATNILRVRSEEQEPGDKERERLLERKEALEDRLKALSVREDVFRGAAKTQSSKAARKTKASPEPIDDIRRGTDFALARLEDVYRQKRKTEADIAEVDVRLKALGDLRPARLVRIWTSGEGKLALRFIRTDRKWIPEYALRLDNGKGRLLLYALLPKENDRAHSRVVNGTLSMLSPQPVEVFGTFPKIAEYALNLERSDYSNGPIRRLAVSFHNDSGSPLPAGELSAFWQGEYIGLSPLAASAPGEAISLLLGP